MAEASKAVQMEDGSTKNFPPKWKAIKESKSHNGGIDVTIYFVDGRVRKYHAPASVVHAAAASGVEHKFAAAYTGAENVDDMIEACEALQANLTKGDFTTRVEGQGFAGASVLMRALMEYSGKTREQVEAALAGYPQALKMQMRSSTKPNAAGITLKSIVDRIETERAQKRQEKKPNAEVEAALAAF